MDQLSSQESSHQLQLYYALREPADHLAAMQPVSTTHIRLALASEEAQPPGLNNRVDKDGVVAVQFSRFGKALADSLLMAGL